MVATSGLTRPVMKIEIIDPATNFAALEEMRQVKVLRIDHASGDGDLVWPACLAAVAKLTQLEELHITSVQDAGSLRRLASLVNLKSISIGFNWREEEESGGGGASSVASLFAHLPSLPRLEALDVRSWENGLGYHALGGNDLEQLFRQPRLKTLNISDINVTDAGLAKLSSLKSLEELAISGDTVTATRLRMFVALPNIKRLHLQRYAAVNKETVDSLAKQSSAAPDEDMLQTNWNAVYALKALKELGVELFGSRAKNDRLTTVTLDGGDRVFALESEVDGFAHALNDLRRAHPGIVIDADPKWFEPYRGEMPVESHFSPQGGGGMF